MPSSAYVILDVAPMSARLRKGAEFLAGNDALSKECLTALGGVGLTLERNYFEAHSKPSDGFWAKLGPATVILRKGGMALTSEADIEAKRAMTPKMRDTQSLLDSLTLGGTHNVFEVGKGVVTVGTNDPRAAVLHNGGETDPFVFDEEKRRVFKANVPELIGGGRAPKATGKLRQWKKLGLQSPWNPLHFLWRGIFRKWEREGRRGRVPARPIIVPLDDRGRQKLMTILRDYIRKAFGGR
jgi:phage gpG-like protein